MSNIEPLQIPKANTGKPEITMAPLVDIVFLLLIFFMVTTIFPDNEGLVIEKPASENAAPLENSNIVLKLDQQGVVYFKNREVDLSELEQLLKTELASKPDSNVILHADRRSTTESLVQVIDISKASGATRLGIATDEKPAEH